MMKEEWRQMEDYEGWYEISDAGSVKRVMGGQGARIGRELKQSKNGIGYYLLNLSKGGTKKQYYIHRLVAAAFIGPCPDGKQVNHKDGDKSNNCSSNLEYVTPSENILHAIRIGIKNSLHCIGTNNANAVLSEAEVLKIRELLDCGCLSQVEIGDMFGVRQTTISAINTGRSWSRLK